MSLSWSERTVSVKDLKPYERNPRKINKDAFAHLKRSMAEDGYHGRLLCTPDNRVIGGHQRLKVMQELGWKECAVLVPDRELTDDEYRRLLVRDNLQAGEWDMDMLANDFEPEELLDWGFPENLLPKQEGVVNEPEGDEDEAPEAPAIPQTVRGDVYEIGSHRLMCGDSTLIDDVDKLMGGAKADMVFTDPPYRMEVEGGSNQMVGRAAAKLGEAIKHLCDFDPQAFLATLPTQFKTNTLNAYVFCNKDLIPDYLRWGVDAGYSFNLLFWKKPSAIPLGGQHRPDVEYLIYFRKSAHWNNGIKDANYSKVLEYGREGDGSHPTMKPVAMIENCLKISSPDRGKVLDFFGGSGSTMVAAHKLGRTAYLMELDEKYCDVIVQRMHKLFPELPIKRNGELFAMEVAERGKA